MVCDAAQRFIHYHSAAIVLIVPLAMHHNRTRSNPPELAALDGLMDCVYLNTAVFECRVSVMAKQHSINHYSTTLATQQNNAKQSATLHVRRMPILLVIMLTE